MNWALLDHADDRRLILASGLLVFVCFLISLYLISRGWQQGLFDLHIFRQTQTAISTLFMANGGPLFIYETPVRGAPWTIPLEFPLYQWSVVVIHKAGIPLEQAGRWVSALYFYLTIPGASWLVVKASKHTVTGLWFASLMLTCGFYLFWSRAFLIESCALFLSVYYLLFLYRFAHSQRLPDLVCGCLFGSLAMLVKATTFVGFCYLGGLIILGLGHRRGYLKDFRFWTQPLARAYWLKSGVFLAGIPVLTTLVWLHITDEIKLLSPLGINLTTANLSAWNYGNLSDKFSYTIWETLLYRLMYQTGGPYLGMLFTVVLVAGVLFGRHRHILLALMLVFCLSIWTFIPLHWAHDYYQYANLIFLLAAFSIALGGITVGSITVGSIANRTIVSLLGLGLVTLSVVLMVNQFTSYWQFQLDRGKAHHLETDLTPFLAQNTEPDDVLIILGQSWSSAIPYASRRRALSLPDGDIETFKNNVTSNDRSLLGGHRAGALVDCGVNPDLKAEIQQFVVDRFGLMKEPTEVSGCTVFLRRPDHD